MPKVHSLGRGRFVVDSPDGTAAGIWESSQGDLLQAEMDARRRAAAPDLMAALRAIIARIDGVYDHPDLMDFGPLDVDTEADCKAIATAAIAKAV